MHTVYIVEDDPSVVLDCEMILQDLPVEICGVADSVPKALKELKSLTPDLAIVDIYVKDRLGFDVVQALNKRNIPSIICTGFPKESNFHKSLDLKVHSFIAKPIVDTVLKFEISRIINAIQSSDYFVYNRTKFELVKLNCSNIMYLEADGNHTVIQTIDKKHIVRKSLSKIYENLPTLNFCRIHRGIIINTNYVDHVQISENKVHVNNLEFPIGKNYKSDFLDSITRDKPLI